MECQQKKYHSRFSLVCILRICLFKCSPRAKHLPQPGTRHVYPRVRFVTPSGLTTTDENVGTLRPRDFLVKFGTGTGTGADGRDDLEGIDIGFCEGTRCIDEGPDETPLMHPLAFRREECRVEEDSDCVGTYIPREDDAAEVPDRIACPCDGTTKERSM